MNLKLLFTISAIMLMLFTLTAQETFPLSYKLNSKEATVTFGCDNKKISQAEVFDKFDVKFQIKSHTFEPISVFPYIESFESGSEWLISDPIPPTAGDIGSFPMKISALQGIDPIDGDNYLVSGYAAAGRDAWAFSPGIELTGGNTYYVYIYFFGEGYQGVKDEFKITIGNGQNSTSQSTTIMDKTGKNAVSFSELTLLESTYTPSENGIYYFAINHCTPGDVNGVAFDYFIISETKYAPPPTGTIKMCPMGSLWSFLDKKTLFSSVTNPFIYTPVTSNTENHEWNFDASANNISYENNFVLLNYDIKGQHIANLTVSGLDGSTIDIKDTINIIRPEALNNNVVTNIDPTGELYTYNLTKPAYVFGTNSNYTHFAELYTLPADLTVSLSQISFYVSAYAITSENISKKITINIMNINSQTGLPKDLIATYQPTYSEVFGTTTIGNTTLKGIQLEKPLEITGSFFVTVDISSMGVPQTDNYLGLCSSEDNKLFGYSTAYVYYENSWINANKVVLRSSIAMLLDLTSVNPKSKAEIIIPENNATEVTLSAPVKVIFNMNIKSSNLNTITITDKEGNEVSNIRPQIINDTLLINHADFIYEKLYKVSIPAGTVGNMTPISWSFTTVDQPLFMENTNPIDDAQNIVLNSEVQVGFNKNITLNNAHGISIINDKNIPIDGIKATTNGNILNISHNEFTYNTSYTVTIPADAIEGYTEPIVWSFSTIPEPITIRSITPSGGAKNIELNAVIQLIFNKNITLIDADKINIVNMENIPVKRVTGTVDGTALNIAHDMFFYNTTYTVKIPAGTIEGYAEPVSWSFTTLQDPRVSLESFSFENIIVYPNPTYELININTPENSFITLTDITGKILNTYNSTGSMQLNLNYTNGFYFIRIEYKGKAINYKILLQK